MINIAILITCYNRRTTTYKAIQKIYNQKKKFNYKIKIFLTDDNSSDNTADFIKKNILKL